MFERRASRKWTLHDQPAASSPTFQMGPWSEHGTSQCWLHLNPLNRIWRIEIHWTGSDVFKPTELGLTYLNPLNWTWRSPVKANHPMDRWIRKDRNATFTIVASRGLCLRLFQSTQPIIRLFQSAQPVTASCVPRSRGSWLTGSRSVPRHFFSSRDTRFW